MSHWTVINFLKLLNHPVKLIKLFFWVINCSHWHSEFAFVPLGFCEALWENSVEITQPSWQNLRIWACFCKTKAYRIHKKKSLCNKLFDHVTGDMKKHTTTETHFAFSFYYDRSKYQSLSGLIAVEVPSLRKSLESLLQLFEIRVNE